MVIRDKERRRSRSAYAVTLLLGLLLTGCASLHVNTDYDPQRDFGSFQRYAWLEPGPAVVQDPLVQNDLMAQRIRRAADTVLAARGYTLSNVGDADFLVGWHVSAETRMDIDTFHSNFGYYPCWGCIGPYYRLGYDRDLTVRHYKSGSFMLDIIDPETRQLVWRGIVERRLTQGSPEQRDQYVSEIIEAILAEFPPQ